MACSISPTETGSDGSDWLQDRRPACLSSGCHLPHMPKGTFKNTFVVHFVVILSIERLSRRKQNALRRSLGLSFRSSLNRWSRSGPLQTGGTPVLRFWRIALQVAEEIANLLRLQQIENAFGHKGNRRFSELLHLGARKDCPLIVSIQNRDGLRS